MTTNRLEAFSDGVLAVIITVMVLELHTPKDESWHSLWSSTGVGLLTYLLSFVYVGIYWSNHHHMFQVAEHTDGAVLWANLHLLFWLSLFPFTTAWIDHTQVARVPAVVYGLNLLAAAIAYYLLQLAIFRTPGGERLRSALGEDWKGKLSPVAYVVGIGLAFVVPWLAEIPYVAVALVWLVPDRRVERFLASERSAA
jgi:uncharacterized membrane protein